MTGNTVPHIHSTVFAASLPYIEELAGAGSVDRALGKTDLDRRALSDPPLFIPLKVQATLAEALARETGSPHFATIVTGNMPYERLGIYARYVLGGQNLDNAIKRGIRGFRYIYPHSTVSMHVEGDRAFLAFDLNLCNHIGANGLEESFVKATIKLARHYAGDGWAPERVELTRKHNDPPEILEEMYDAEVHFGARLPGIVFPANVLKTGNPALPAVEKATVFGELRQLMRQHPGDRFSNIVKQAIDLQMRVGEISIDHVALRLNIGARTLQRRLAAESETFQSCLDSFRLERAKSLLVEDTCSIAKIALSLGFEEPNSFRRFFRKWIGMSATDFRKLRRSA